MCIQEYFRLVLCWEVCLPLEYSLSCIGTRGREKVMQYFPYRIDLNIETRGRKKLKLDNEVKVSQNDKNPEL